MLKGLDLTLETFSELEDLDLYICGNIKSNERFTQIYQRELFNTENIHLMGWTDLMSKRFEALASKCAYTIYPTASDASQPSSLVSAMRTGMIPIATKDVIEQIGQWGVPLESTRINSISNTVVNAAKLPSDEVRKQAIDTYYIANTSFTRDRYTQDLIQALSDIINTRS